MLTPPKEGNSFSIIRGSTEYVEKRLNSILQGGFFHEVWNLATDPLNLDILAVNVETLPMPSTNLPDFHFRLINGDRTKIEKEQEALRLAAKLIGPKDFAIHSNDVNRAVVLLRVLD